MTQTILKNKQENSVEIWADFGQREKYCFTANVSTFTKSEFEEQVKWCDYDNADMVLELKQILDLFSTTENEYIFKCTATSGHDDYCEYFATHKEAMDDCERQTC